ncbi:hypothetical protein [Streptosporangium vulgare]
MQAAHWPVKTYLAWIRIPDRTALGLLRERRAMVNIKHSWWRCGGAE